MKHEHLTYHQWRGEPRDQESPPTDNDPWECLLRTNANLGREVSELKKQRDVLSSQLQGVITACHLRGYNVGASLGGWTMNSTTPLVDAAVNDTAFEDKNQPHTDWITAHAGREIEARLNEARRELSEARAALLLSREMHNDCERERQSCVVEFDSAVGQLTEMDKQLAESHAREAQLREALDAIARRMHVMGSTGEFREGQLDALSAVAEQARIALTLPAPPVVPVEDVKPLIKALADVIALATFWGPDRYSNDLERAKISLSTFTAKHKP